MTINPEPTTYKPRWLLRLLTATAFIIFAQAYRIAPILPHLAQVFGIQIGIAGLAIPAFLVPYGLMTLLWGPLSDRIGRRPVIIGSLVAFTVLTAATALTSIHSIRWFRPWQPGIPAPAHCRRVHLGTRSVWRRSHSRRSFRFSYLCRRTANKARCLMRCRVNLSFWLIRVEHYHNPGLANARMQILRDK